MASIHVNAMPIDAEAVHCVLHLEGEFAGNLDIGIAFSGEVPLDDVQANLLARTVGGTPKPVDVIGYDVTDNNYDITSSWNVGDPPDELEFIWKDGDVSLGMIEVEHSADSPRESNEPSAKAGCGASVLTFATIAGTLKYLMS